MKIAFKLDNVGFVGEAHLYRLSEPLEGHEYVIVSAINLILGPETLVFPANKHGEIQGWGDSLVKLEGTWDHSLALQSAGYEYVEGDNIH